MIYMCAAHIYTNMIYMCYKDDIIRKHRSF